jgi:hypothetical protein
MGETMMLTVASWGRLTKYEEKKNSCGAWWTLWRKGPYQINAISDKCPSKQSQMTKAPPLDHGVGAWPHLVEGQLHGRLEHKPLQKHTRIRDMTIQDQLAHDMRQELLSKSLVGLRSCLHSPAVRGLAGGRGEGALVVPGRCTMDEGTWSAQPPRM